MTQRAKILPSLLILLENVKDIHRPNLNRRYPKILNCSQKPRCKDGTLRRLVLILHDGKRLVVLRAKRHDAVAEEYLEFTALVAIEELHRLDRVAANLARIRNINFL